MTGAALRRRVLVVGCTGFIGRHVGQAFRVADPGAEIVGAARSPVAGGSFDRVTAVDSGPIEAALRRLIVETAPDVVVNCVGALSNDPDIATMANETAATALVDACIAEAPQALLIQIGSSAEYAPLQAPERSREDGPAEPTSTYGATKLRGTQAVLARAAAARTDAVVLRVFNVLGPGMSTATMPGRVVDFVRNGTDAELRVGSLDAYRDFVDVRDAARAVTAAVSHRRRLAGEVVNVGTGRARQSRELAEGIVARSPRPVQLIESEPDSVRSAGVSWQEADPDKAARLLGWSAALTWNDTLDYLVSGEVVR